MPNIEPVYVFLVVGVVVLIVLYVGLNLKPDYVCRHGIDRRWSECPDCKDE